MVTFSEEVRPAVERVPVTSAGPPTTRLAVASMLETEMVPPDNLLLTVRFEVSTLDVVMVPVTEWKLLTVRFEVLMLDTLRILSAPVMVTFSDEVRPAVERVPVTSAGPPTTKLAVTSMLETEMVPPERRLLTVRLDVLMLDTLRILFAPVMVTFSDEVRPAA